MSFDSIVFLDPIPDAKNIAFFQSGAERLYLANTLNGLARYKEESSRNPGALAVWIRHEHELKNLKESAEALGAQFLFAYSGLRPSQVIEHGSFLGPRNTELPDPRIKDISLFELQPQVLQKASRATAKFSVIIPIFDNEARALKALSAWSKQNYFNYEIILVDDGSHSRWLSSLIGSHPENLTLVQLSRKQKRSRGDYAFRAGLARNAGFALSQGEFIVFADSDILVAREMLTSLEQEFQAADVVMPQRWQLHARASQDFTEYEQIRFNSDVVLSPGAFWESFQTEPHAWGQHENFWRWTSTFLLAVRRSALLEVGGFKKSFVTYGFEDTELGYRLYKSGFRFKLAGVKTYHLHQSDSQSEYQNDLRQKKRLLKISADRFFRHHPAKEVYDSLRTWLD